MDGRSNYDKVLTGCVSPHRCAKVARRPMTIRPLRARNYPLQRRRGLPCAVSVPRMESREAPGCLRGTHDDEPLRGVRPRAATRTDCESVSRGARVMQRQDCEAHRADAAPPGAPPPPRCMRGEMKSDIGIYSGDEEVKSTEMIRAASQTHKYQRRPRAGGDNDFRGSTPCKKCRSGS